MDREELKRKIKEAASLLLTAELIIIALGLLLLPIAVLAVTTVMAIFDVIILCGMSIMIIIINISEKKEREIVSKDYYREIDENYTPAMASFMIDGNIEIKEAILSTILDLATKKYLKLKNKDQDIEVHTMHDNIDKLYLHEQYIVKSIRNNQLIDPNIFEQYIIQDCKEKELVKHAKIKLTKVFMFIYIVTLLLFCLVPTMMEVNITFLIITFLLWLCSIFGLFIAINIKSYRHTEKGKVFATQSKQLKNFIKDYTLLSERDIEDINLFGRYVPYAIALGEAKKIEREYIKYDNWKNKYIE